MLLRFVVGDLACEILHQESFGVHFMCLRLPNHDVSVPMLLRLLCLRHAVWQPGSPKLDRRQPIIVMRAVQHLRLMLDDLGIR